MKPTKTDRRHFFLLDGTTDMDTASRSLVSIGLEKSDNDNETFSNDFVQIKVKSAPTDSNDSYIGGTIFPKGRIIQRIPNLRSIAKAFSQMFYGFMILFVILWLLAFILASLYPLEIVNFLGFPIGLLLFLAITSVFGVVLSRVAIDVYASRHNLSVVKEFYPKLVSSFDHFFLDILVQPISIKTRIGSLDILKHLPTDFAGKIESLNLGVINEHFWSS